MKIKSCTQYAKVWCSNEEEQDCKQSTSNPDDILPSELQIFPKYKKINPLSSVKLRQIKTIPYYPRFTIQEDNNKFTIYY